MLKKLSFIIPIAIFTLLAGCGTPSQTKKDSTVRAIALAPQAEAHPMVADLEVSDKKVMGQAQGKLPAQAQRRLHSQASLEREAIAAALKQTDGDVLVGVNYFYELIKNTDLTVTAVGYPARYKNFRPKEKENKKSDILLKGQFTYEDGSNNNLSVTIKNAPSPTAQKEDAPTANTPEE